MARQIDVYADCEVRSVIRFFAMEDLSASEIHRKICARYGSNVMSVQSVRKWCRSFREEGRTDVHDEPRSGRPSDSTTDIFNVQQLRDLLEEDRRMTISELCFRLQSPDCSRASVGRIVRDVFGMRKLSSRWVPRLLTEEHKANRMGAALDFLTRFNEEGVSLLDRVVTGDETWVHHTTPESKEASKQWCEPDEPRPKKAKVANSAGKIMATVFWDSKGILLTRYMPKGTTINSETYCQILKDLRASLYRKRPGLKAETVFLIHDNARPHTSALTQNLLTQFKWEIFKHPPYSPDCAPSDFWLFPKLKQALGGKKFKTDAEVKLAVNDFFRKQSPEFYAMGIEKLVPRYNKCLDLGGEYVEK